MLLFIEANNKYMNDYDKNEDPSYLKYWDVSNFITGERYKSFL